MRPLLTSLALFALVSSGAHAQTTLREVGRLANSPAFKAAEAALEAGHDAWVQDIIKLSEIPAPPFGEGPRAEAYAAMLRAEGLTDVTIDAEGNVIGLRRGTGPEGGKVLVVSAHLDTVFPIETDVKVRREGTRLLGPGVGDDASGLATMLELLRAMKKAGLQTRQDILFVGTVGEEGQGDLRGVRYLFTKGPWKDRIGGFFSIDSSGAGRIVDTSVGSKRYRMMFRGPGGHSYGAFGIVNPAAALGKAIADFYQTVVPTSPKVTYSVSVLGGGQSVNSIPSEVWMEVDTRSADPVELAKIEARLMAVAQGAVEAENAARSTANGPVTFEPVPIGDRPAGTTAPDSALVRATLAAHTHFRVPVQRSASSTDSNIPMSLGIPALTLPGNALAGRAHALDEWLDVSKEPNVALRRVLMATVVATANAN